jgi:hypothetical protein
VKRVVIGLVLLAAGLAGLAVFREPVGVYTVDIAGSGDTAGQLVDVECENGQAIGVHQGDQRAESECELAEDSEETTRIIKLAGAGVVALFGIGMIHSGYRLWARDFRSRRAYRRMVRDHDLAGPGRRRAR